MIIICGQDESLGNSKNVMEQFRQFVENCKTGTTPLIIPLPSTDYAARVIFESEEFIATPCFQENSEFFKQIGACGDPEQLAWIVVNLISSYRIEPNV